MERPRSGEHVVLGIVEIWSFSDPTVGDIDPTGYTVEACGDRIGRVDEAVYESGASYLVVDTGPWIFGKKVVLPAGTVEAIDPESETVTVGLMKDEIKAAPEYDPERGMSGEFRRELATYYSSIGERGRSSSDLSPD